MEQIQLITVVSIVENNAFHIDFYPANTNLRDVVMHGADLTITGTLLDTISSYLPTAQAAMFAVIDQRYPGQYTF